MSKLLILASGECRDFRRLNGESILADLPFDTLVFVDRSRAHHFAHLEDPRVTIRVVRWSDQSGILRLAREAHAEHGLSGVATLDERNVAFAAMLRAEIDLPGLKPDEVRPFRDKIAMKELLHAAGVRVPHFTCCTDRVATEALLRQHGRIVLKPVSGLGSRGVSIISSETDLNVWFGDTRHPEDYEAEEFIDGVLYHLNALVCDGVSLLTSSAPYLPGQANIDFSCGTPFVTSIIGDQALAGRMEGFSAEVIAALGLRNGVTHLECFLTPQNEIVFCEIAVRPGGGGIVWMIEAQHEVHYGRCALLLEAGLGGSIRFAERKLSIAALIGFRSNRQGTLKRIADSRVFSDPWIHLAQNYHAPGDFVAPSAHCTDYLGLIIFSSKDEKEFHSRREEIVNRFYADFELSAA